MDVSITSSNMKPMRTTTINHNFFIFIMMVQTRGTESVLPDGTDGPLQTLYGSSHDNGLIMVSLENRFIIVDYGIVPTQANMQTEVINPYVATPYGAGKMRCVTPNCGKVGVSVLWYASECRRCIYEVDRKSGRH